MLGEAIAIGVLGGIAVWGWLLYASNKKTNGELLERVAELEGERDARIDQERAFDRHRGTDLADDRKFLSDDDT